MEERYDSFICPNCGKEMRKGITHGSQRPYLLWYPGRNAPSSWELTRLPNAEKCDDPSGGVYFGSISDWFSTSYRPAWYCHSCGLLLIDTKTQLAKE